MGYFKFTDTATLTKVDRKCSRAYCAHKTEIDRTVTAPDNIDTATRCGYTSLPHISEKRSKYHSTY